MKDIPIIFSAPMVCALLAGRKTMTRRLAWRACDLCGDTTGSCNGPHKPTSWQRVEPGDRLWVRESGAELNYANRCNPVTNADEYEVVGWLHSVGGTIVGYNGSDPIDYIDDCARTPHPSIHMPRWASRLTLEVTAVRVERLRDILHADAVAEGVEGEKCRWKDYLGNEPSFMNAVASFASLWTKLHGADSWAANPEVVALTFAVHQQNIDTFKRERVAA